MPIKLRSLFLEAIKNFNSVLIRFDRTNPGAAVSEPPISI
jgi:hypothetical protein